MLPSLLPLPYFWDFFMGVKPGGTRLPNVFVRKGTLMLLSPQLLHDTKSIFCHQVQFFYSFYHLKSVITNLGWMSGINCQIIWLHSSNILEIVLVILLVNAFVLPPTFPWHKVNLLPSSSVIILLFLPPKVSDYKPGMDEGYNPQIIWLHFSNNLEI